MKFSRAMLHVKKGYTVKRKAWGEDEFGIFMSSDALVWDSGTCHPYQPTLDDVFADDWYIVQ